MLHEIVRLGQALGARSIRAIGGQLVVGRVSAFQLELKRTVGLGSHFRNQRSRSIKVAEHKLAIGVAAVEGAGIAIDAQDGCGDIGAGLLYDEAPCLLALGAVILNLPYSADVGNGPLNRGGLDMGPCHEGNRGDIGVALETAEYLAFEFAIYRCGNNLG